MRRTSAILFSELTKIERMTVLISTTLITVLALITMVTMRRRGSVRVQPIQAIQAILRLRGRGTPKTGLQSKRNEPAGKFHAVTIELDPHACPAILEYEGETLLSKDAPILPLAECDQASCQCRFVHHDDRRRQGRRGYQSDLARIAELGANDERRKRAGRRENDRSGLE